MSLHPEVQSMAHEQLDAVVGPSRLPTLGDREALPFVDTILKETLRWHVVLPLGVSHAMTVDDEYDGYFIPSGTVIQPNLW